MKILLLSMVFVVTACSKEPEKQQQSDEKTQKEWTERNTSKKDFEKHESKGF